MSSGVESGGVIAAAVMSPVAIAFGAGWLAWQGGKLLVEAGRAMEEEIANKQRQMEEAARHRMMAARAAHDQLADLCAQLLQQMDAEAAGSADADFAEAEQLKYDLQRICQTPLPDDAGQIESITSMGYHVMEDVVRRKNHLAALRLQATASGLYQGQAVADLMDDLRLAVEAVEIRAAKGADVTAADPLVLERSKLNGELSQVTAKIMAALDTIEEFTRSQVLTPAASTWFHSCFNGIDAQIQQLCRPTTTNAELKKGLHRLREALAQYEMMLPSIRKNAARMSSLYAVYVDASKALGEPIAGIRSFPNPEDIEKKLQYLNRRAEKAKACAEIYQVLGPSAYLCYAWDQELQAMGYEVHSRKEIEALAMQKMLHGKAGENKLPFYQWAERDLTQLYSISAECDLQVIVHDDGTVSMQSIAWEKSPEVVNAQKTHCAQLRILLDRLRENWFISYDYEETASPDMVMTVSQWRGEDPVVQAEAGRTDARGRRKREEEKKLARGSGEGRV